MNYEIKNNLPVLLEWKNKRNHFLDSEPNYECCSYDLNDYGYRAGHDYEPILDDEDKIICIGCSFTFGIGLYEQETWPYKLSKLVGSNFMNLGFPGGSIRYVLWQLYNVIDKIPNKNIFVLIPPLGRTFNLTDSHFFCENNKMEVNESYFEYYLIKNFCEKNNIIHFDHSFFGERENSIIELGFARDVSHYGEQYQNAVANKFYEMI